MGLERVEKTFVISSSNADYSLYCTCGFTNDYHEEISACPECQKEVELYLNHGDPVAVYTDVEITEDDNLIKASAISNIHHYKLGVLEVDRMPWTYQFDKKEDKLFVSAKDWAPMDIETNCLPKKLKRYNLKYQSEFLTPFVSKIFRHKGIDFIHPEAVLNSSLAFCNLMLLVKYPEVQNYLFSNYGVEKMEDIPSMAKKILDYPDYATFFKNYTHHTTKSVRNIVGVDAAKFNMLSFWGKVIQKPDNIKKVMDTFACDHNPHVFGAEQYQDRDTEFYHGVEVIKELSQNNETVAINRIISYFKKKKRLSSKEAIVYLADIGNMANTIRLAEPDFEIQFDKDLERFHDNLVKDSIRVKDKPLPLKYEGRFEYQRKWEEEREGHYFKLPESTTDLKVVGAKMSICVGGYGSSAFNKHCTIVFMNNKANNTVVCLEVRNNELVQAKMKCNALPTKDLSLIIRSWAREHGISITTRDL
jgi:hypothetical protein